ncbi:hypothetical protein RD00_17280 [Pseudomonas amygdali pv. tabaci]|nr:hypothetical protein RD00_17280 [Pseudomonas amygdali pv. tabaci]
MGRQKQMAAKRRQIRIRTASACKGSTTDVQAVMLDRVEDPQAGIGAVARHQHHFHARLVQAGIEAQKFFNQWESVALFENLILVLNLILAVGLHAVGHIHLVAVAKIEQRPR